MLKVKQLSKAFEKPVITDFSYEFEDTGLYLIRGASGSGKSTLLNLLGGLLKADSGEILFKKEPRISYVFQDARLVPNLTLLENILLVKKERNKKTALEILEKLGLSDSAKKYPDALSGGMKLRGALTRSLYYGGNIYLWDEPTKELDGENRKIVIDTIKRLSKTALVIVATHDDKLRSQKEILL